MKVGHTPGKVASGERTKTARLPVAVPWPRCQGADAERGAGGATLEDRRDPGRAQVTALAGTGRGEDGSARLLGEDGGLGYRTRFVGLPGLERVLARQEGKRVSRE